MEMPSNCVSIITRTRDRPILIARAVESVLKQSYENWVHIIVNDGGQNEILDQLLEKRRERYRGRLRLLSSPTSLGAGGALVVGMAAAQSDYIVTHDDDDSWDREFLRKTIAALQSQKAIAPSTRGVICHTTVVREYIKGDRIVEKYRYSFNGWVKGVSLTRLFVRNFIPPISFLFERTVFAEIGPFSESFHPIEDWEFYLRFICKFDIVVLPEHLANYHLRAASMNAYGNTVVAGINRHKVVGVLLRNSLIREDLEAGNFGRGYLIALTAGSVVGDWKHRLFGGIRRAHASLAPAAIFQLLREKVSNRS